MITGCSCCTSAVRHRSSLGSLNVSSAVALLDGVHVAEESRDELLVGTLVRGKGTGAEHVEALGVHEQVLEEVRVRLHACEDVVQGLQVKASRLGDLEHLHKG